MKKTRFTKEMAADYTILVPPMAPIHERLLLPLVNQWGYHLEMMTNDGLSVMRKGLAYCHNDTCYPAQVIIGEMMDCIESGRYDRHKLAFLITQTGGGCRASNYIALMRKALDNASYDDIPIISMSVQGMEKSGFRITLPMAWRMCYFAYIGDLLMTLKNQCALYEVNPGETDRLVDHWIEKILRLYPRGKRMSYRSLVRCFEQIVRDFEAVERKVPEKRVRVGIVGEIFVKFSPYGNNRLEEFLQKEGAEPVLGSLMDFLLYCVSNSEENYRLYGTGALKAFGARRLQNILCRVQKRMIRIIRENSSFSPMACFEDLLAVRENFISRGVKMGEGWLLTAEMLDFCREGVKNIICTQPFGCLPNHIIGKGMIKGVREKYPGANIVAIDYDFSNTKANQENRIKLMLANAAESD